MSRGVLAWKCGAPLGFASLRTSTSGIIIDAWPP